MTKTRESSPPETSKPPVTSRPIGQDQEASPWTPRAKALTFGVLAVWAGLATLIGVTGAVLVPPEAAFRPIALTATLPVVLFLLAYALSPRFKAFVLAQDIGQLTTLQHWRVIGFGFLLLYAYDVLPGGFAWPAGVGDFLVGLAAPLIMIRLAADKAFIHSRRFAAFHLAGLADFALAVGAAMLTSGAFPAIYAGALTSAPMEVWPLNLFPSFGVPIFIILHLSVFLKLAALRRAARSGDRQGPVQTEAQRQAA